MEEKPVFYDGSLHNEMKELEYEREESFILTDEVRASISGNPFYS